MDFNELEASEGLRWSWNAWPCTPKEVASLVLPLGIMCTPLMPMPELPLLPYEPVHCRGCRGVLNPYCRVDFRAKLWNCCFCLHRNAFPTTYSSISEDSLPAELFPTYTSVEYILPRFPSGYSVVASSLGNSQPNGPAFLFVLDTSIDAQDLRLLKNAILQMLGLLPEGVLVGLLTFGRMVHVYELGYTDCSKLVVFDGERELSTQKVQELLGIQKHHASMRATAIREGGGIGRFLLPLCECEFSLTTALEELQPSSYTTERGHRPERAMGTAITVAAALMEASMANSGSRIMLFVAGPATVGPGMVVETSLEKSIRTHRELFADSAPLSKKALKFYKSLSQCLADSAIALDLFACSLDQVGAHELKPLIESSGGIMVLSETFDSEQFKKSLQCLFARDKAGDLKMYFDATLEVIATREVKLSGALGPCTSMGGRNTDSVGDNLIGIGGTTIWKVNTLTDKTCIAFFFELTSQASKRTLAQPGAAFFLQFLTKYRHTNGEVRLRVTTTARRWVSGTETHDVTAGFDQEAAAALVSRLAVSKAEKEEETFEIVRWLDEMLIAFASKFGDYVKEDASSFRLSSNLSLFPQFVFHLRRSQFLQVFNNTPDETVFFRLALNRENVTSTVIMIQPTLFSYSLTGPPIPVALDVGSINPCSILLFDSHFFVVIHYGSTIAQWRRLGYQNEPTYENFKRLLEAPLQDARALIAERLPVPKLVECDQHGSQARFLLAKLNPSVTHKSEHAGDSDVIFTDDVSLEVFITHLQELAVKE